MCASKITEEYSLCGDLQFGALSQLDPTRRPHRSRPTKGVISRSRYNIHICQGVVEYPSPVTGGSRVPTFRSVLQIEKHLISAEGCASHSGYPAVTRR